MISKPIEQPKLKEENYSEFYESGFISFIHEFLNNLFKLALLNFSKKKSKFTLNENFQKLFDDNNKNNMNEFKNLVEQLSQELSSIQDFIDSNSKDIDFSSKDINMDILIESINNCFMFCRNDLNIDEIIDNLIKLFQRLIAKKKIKSNNNSKIIITQFQNYINCYLNYIDKIKSITNNTVKIEEEKKNNDTQIHEYIIKIKKLEEEIKNYNFKLNQKKNEIEEEKNKNAELNQILTKKSKELQICQSESDNIKNILFNEIKNLNNKFDESMKNMEKKHSEEIKNMKKKHSEDVEILNTRMKKLEKENSVIKFRTLINFLHLRLKDEKLEKFQELIKQVRHDMNKLADIGKDISEGLNKTIETLDNVKIIVDSYELELGNLDNLFG